MTRTSTTPVTYAVVEAEPEAVATHLQRLWGANLTVAGDVARKFRWLYRDAPDRAGVVFMLAARGGEADGAGDAFVGTAGVCVRRFQVGGREVTAALLADLAVDRDHRSLLPALNLVRQVKAHALGAHALAYGFPNHNAVGVFKRAGYQALGTINRYARVLRHHEYIDHIRNSEVPRLPGPALFRRVVDRALAIPPLARAGTTAIDVGRLLQGTPDVMRAWRHHRLEWLDGPDERFDALWEHARAEYAIVARRSAAFLRWRFPADPGTRYAALVRRSDRSVVAYAVVQLEDGTAHLRDLFGHHDAFAPLIDRLLPALYRRGATSASIRYLGGPRLTELLARRGFAQRPGERTIMWAAATPTPGDPAQWHLLDADEDT